MAMAQAAYFVAQQIYAGWALFGIVLFGALIANLAHAIVLRKLGRSFGYALASFLLIAANLAIFFVWTFPTNQATNNWTVVPKNWNAANWKVAPTDLPQASSFWNPDFNIRVLGLSLRWLRLSGQQGDGI